jgi:hypothetical protein
MTPTDAATTLSALAHENWCQDCAWCSDPATTSPGPGPDLWLCQSPTPNNVRFVTPHPFALLVELHVSRPATAYKMVSYCNEVRRRLPAPDFCPDWKARP